MNIVEELLLVYDPSKLSSETSVLMEKFLSRAVLKYVFLQEDIEEEIGTAMELMRRMMTYL